MGGKESKQFPISTEDALKRVNDAERRRLQDAFRRYANSSGYITRLTFLRDVLGESIPTTLAEQIFSLCVAGFGHSGVTSSLASRTYETATAATSASTSGSSGYSSTPGSSKGLSFKEVLAALVLLTRGTHEEKIKFIYGLLACDNGAYIERDDAMRIISEWESGHVPDAVTHSLFNESEKITFENFSYWMDNHSECMAISRWLLLPNQNLSLVNKIDTPTFYQTLAGVTHLDEGEIVELEKRFWVLAAKNKDKSNRIDINSLRQLVSPPMPTALTTAFFQALDENQDGHIDFKELCCGVSAACRGPDLERQKFCFKLFDADRDGILNTSEVTSMVECMIEIKNQTMDEQNRVPPNIAEIVAQILSAKEKFSADGEDEHDQKNNDFGGSTDGSLTIEHYLVWTVKNDLPIEFSKFIHQICHVVLGLRPQSKTEEGDVVKGWLGRERRASFVAGTIWYLISIDWWNQWQAYVNSQPQSSPFGSLKRNKKVDAVESRLKNPINLVDSTIPNINDKGVVGTSYTLIESDVTTSSKNHNLKVPDSTSANSSRNSSRLSTPSNSPFPSRKHNSGIKYTNNGAYHVPARPGPIDNCHLIQSSPKVTILTGEGGKLKSATKIVQGRDFEIIPERLWKALYQWYSGTPSLPRQVIRNKKSEIELELRPLSIRILRHQTVNRSPVSQGIGGNTVSSMGYGGMAMHYSGGALGPASGGSTSNLTPKRYHAYQAGFSRRTNILQIEEFLSQRLNVKIEDMRMWFYRDDTNMKLLEESDAALEDEGFVDEDSILVEVRSKDGTWPEEINSLCKDRRASTLPPTPFSAPTGITGLNNLGNTCYMNAAVQCLSNTKILATYFNKNCHLHEINRTNPLGMKGHIAKRFGDLVREMWAGNTRAVAPIKLRWTIGRYATNFSGFQQQDSQEFLAFLLDGLHEDLNRVTTKNYVELKDSDGRPDIVVSQEAELNHSARNKSIVVDLFTGQLKSKVTCKVCGHESVKFDPFTYLSLPLPMESSVHIDVIVIRQDGTVPIKYGLTMDMEARYSNLKKSLSQLCQIPTQNLILVDIVQSQFRVTQNEEIKMKALNGACLFAYEIHLITAKQNDDPKSLADIQRSILNGYNMEKECSDGSYNGNDDRGSASLQSDSGSNSLTLTEINLSKMPSSTEENQRASNSGSNANSTLTPKYKKKSKEGKEDMLLPDCRIEPVTVPVNSASGDTSPGLEIKEMSSEGIVADSINSKCDKEGVKLLEPNSNITQRPCDNEFKTEVGNDERNTKTIDNYLRKGKATVDTKSSTSHSRQSSDSCYTSSSTFSETNENRNHGSGLVVEELGNCTQGNIVGLHRKMMPQEAYFLSTEKYRPVLFGLPIVVSCSGSTTYQDLYKSVWVQVSRLVSPLPPKDQTQNHATDCDDSMGYEYPFLLKVVQRGGSWCAWCPWHRFCRGCTLPCSSQDFGFAASYLAIDWDQTALHLRYLSAQEKAFQEDQSVEISLRTATEPITLNKCLEQFTKQEELGPEEKYYCSSCKSLQLASKKLQIWRLPPVLIVHFKRFHFLNGRWIKSHKIVDFPVKDFDPTDYLAAVPCNTIQRYKELAEMGRTSLARVTTARNIWKNCNGTIDESSETDLKTKLPELDNNCAKFSDKIYYEIQKSNIETLEMSSNYNETQPCNGELQQNVPEENQLQQQELYEPNAANLPKKVTNISVERIFSPKSNRRMRQESTSLYTHPITDDDLQDFHQHKLLPARHPLDIKYNLRSMVCHSGVMGGGHYVSYCKTAAEKWWCQNDSTCKEVDDERIDKASAYILFFDREGLNADEYLPKLDTNSTKLELGDLDDELEMDFKKQCAVM